MFEYTTDKEGNLTGVVDYCICDRDSSLSDKGDYLYINEMYINPNARGLRVVPQIILKIYDRVPWAKWAWFVRRKYKDRPRIYSVEKWVKLARKFTKEEEHYGKEQDRSSTSSTASCTAS